MDIRIDDVALFVRIIDTGSLSGAARERDVPVSKVTRALARLEAGCATRLLNRSTHGLSLTDEGDTFLAWARSTLLSTEALQSDLSGRLAGPRGWVRVGVSAVLAQTVIAPALPGLYERWPGLQLDIAADDRIADMARDGIDIAFRTGSPSSDTVVARQIGVLSRALYAAPAYLAKFGTPRQPGELSAHRLIASGANPQLNHWAYQAGRTAAEFVADGHTRTDNTATALALVRHGAGIGRILTLAAEPLVASGELVRVLPELFVTSPVPMFAVMPQQRQRLPKIRACLDYFSEWIASSRS